LITLRHFLIWAAVGVAAGYGWRWQLVFEPAAREAGAGAAAGLLRPAQGNTSPGAGEDQLICGILLVITAQLFTVGVLNAVTQALCRTVIFFAQAAPSAGAGLGAVGPVADKILSPSRRQLPGLHATCTRPATLLDTRELRCCNKSRCPQGGSAASRAWPGCGGAGGFRLKSRSARTLPEPSL
jgi:hypothetical protein